MFIHKYLKIVVSHVSFLNRERERERERESLDSRNLSQQGGSGRLIEAAALLVAFAGIGLLLIACPVAPIGGGSSQIIGDANDNVLISSSRGEIFYGGGGSDTFRFSGNFGIDSIGSDSSPDTQLDAADIIEYTDSATLSYSYSDTDVTIAQGSNRVTIYSANTASGARDVGASRQESRVDFRLQQGTTIYNVIVGTIDSDTVSGGDPSTTTRLLGGSAADLLWGLDGDDLLVGREGSDILLGGTGNDVILGTEGNDRLIGGPGNDTLYGGGNNPDSTLIGIADNAQGSDIFIFEGGFGNDNIGFYNAIISAHAYGIDASDRLQFTVNDILTLAWSNSAVAGDHDLTITQGSNTVIIYGANDATSDGGFRIMWNGMIERVDSTTDLVVDGS